MTTQAQVSAAMTTVRTARGDDMTAMAEAIRLARLEAPTCVRFLAAVVRAERGLGVSSPMQRTRSAVTLLTVAGLLLSEARSSGVYAEAADGLGDDAAAAS